MTPSRIRSWGACLAMGLALASTALFASAAHAAPGDVVLVSPAVPGKGPNEWSGEVVPASSGNGAFVAYLFNPPFGDPTQANPGAQLFLKKVGDAPPIPVNIPSGEQNGLGFEAGSPSLDGSGDRLSFVSEDPDLSPDDRDFVTTLAGDRYAVRDTFVFERATRKVQLVSRATGLRGAAANGDSNLPSISDDGRYVAFGTSATNLVPRKVFGGIVYGGVFVRDLQKKTTTLVSRAGGRVGGPIKGSTEPSISKFGARVAFSGLAGGRGHRHQAIYVRDLERSRTEVVSRGGARDCVEPSLSADGRTVAYVCRAERRSKGVDQVYVTDLRTGRTSLGSSSARGKAGGGDSLNPSISANGRLLAFTSYSNDLGPRDEGRVTDVFVKDLRGGKVLLASRADGGGAAGNAPSADPSISADGRFVSFDSRASNLVPEDSDRNSSVFRYQIGP